MAELSLSFIDTELGVEDIERISPHMGNWMSVYKYVYGKKVDETEVAKVLLYEIYVNSRLYVIQRLKCRLNHLRSKREDAELVQCLNETLRKA